MLTIARALMMKPDLLILDEPTLGLAPLVMEQISKALERLRKAAEITVLLGEQNVTFALPHADRVYVLERGRIERRNGRTQEARSSFAEGLEFVERHRQEIVDLQQRAELLTATNGLFREAIADLQDAGLRCAGSARRRPDDAGGSSARSRGA